MQNIHFVNVHHRKGLLTDIETDLEIEKRMEAKVEEDAQEIRDNRSKAMRGESVGEKKMPPRETGAVNHEYFLQKYDDNNVYPLPSNNQLNNSPPNHTTNKLPLPPSISAKLSEGFNNNKSLPKINNTNNVGAKTR